MNQAYVKTTRNSLGQFKRSREVMIHESAPIIRNPLAIIAEAKKKLFAGPQFIAAKGTTLNVGRNKAKRERRELSRGWRFG